MLFRSVCIISYSFVSALRCPETRNACAEGIWKKEQPSAGRCLGIRSRYIPRHSVPMSKPKYPGLRTELIGQRWRYDPYDLTECSLTAQLSDELSLHTRSRHCTRVYLYFSRVMSDINLKKAIGYEDKLLPVHSAASARSTATESAAAIWGSRSPG